jgi:hypothetical protein
MASLEEDRLVQQRHEPIGKVSRMDQHERLAGFSYLTLELDALERCPVQASLFHDRDQYR